MPHRPPFDIRRPLVAARGFIFAGEEFKKGDPFPVKDFSPRLIKRQYEAHAIIHTDDSEAGSDPAELVQMTGPSGGRYTITAPWLDKPEVVRGKKPAEDRYAELVDQGRPLGWIEGGTETKIEEIGGGWYQISAPWLAEPEKVQGRDTAEARQREVHELGAPNSDEGEADDDQDAERVDGPAYQVTLTPGGDGFTVSAPWLDQTETYDEAEAAEARQAELRDQGPPEGWEPQQDGGDEGEDPADPHKGPAEKVPGTGPAQAADDVAAAADQASGKADPARSE